MPHLRTYINAAGSTVRAARWVPGAYPAAFALSLAIDLGVSSYAIYNGKIRSCLTVYPGEVRCLEDGEWVIIAPDGWKHVLTDEAFRANWKPVHEAAQRPREAAR